MILLDAGGAILFVFPILLLFFMLVIVAIEAFVISKMLTITLKPRIRIWGFGETEWYKKVMRHGVFLSEKLVVLA